MGFLWPLTPPYRDPIGRIAKKSYRTLPDYPMTIVVKFQVDHVKIQWEIDAQKTALE